MKSLLLILAVLVGMAYTLTYAHMYDTSKNPDEVCINNQCEAEQN